MPREGAARPTPPRRYAPAAATGSNGNGRAGGGASGHGTKERAGDDYDRPKQHVPVPGIHAAIGGGFEDVGNDEFAHRALSHLPAGSIYRSSGVIGRIDGAPGKQRFRELDSVGVSLLLDRHLRLVRWKKDSQKRRYSEFTPCSRTWGALALKKASASPEVRDLRRLVRYPVYLGHPDRGEMRLARPGWHDGVFYDVPDELDGVEPETDCDAIRDTLDDLVTDFPFKEEADRHNFFGLLLTPIVRPALSGNVPQHLVGASLERTGKTKLAEEVLGGVILGEPTPALQMTGSEDEIDKRVLALLVEGESLIHLDNLGEFLDSRVLASLLTATTYKGRWLGTNQMISAPNNLTIVASGNNVKATGEIVKRTVPIILQPADDRPERRTKFSHPDLRAYVAASRPRVIAALLGMVELWKIAGMPPGRKPMGGFESWARVVGGIMHVAGFHGWRANSDAWALAADERGTELRMLIAAWSEAHGDSWRSAADLTTLAREKSLFLSCFVSGKEAGNIVSFSRRVLVPNVDKPVDGFVIRREQSRNGSVYRLEGADIVLPMATDGPGP